MSEQTARYMIRELEHLKESMCARELPHAGREFINKRIGYYKAIIENGTDRFQNNS